MDDHYTRAQAEFVSSLKFDDIPTAVVEHAKICLLDTVGCGLFGSTLPWARIVAECLEEIEAGGPCTLWGMPGKKLSPAGAALVNGTAVHGFELDDLHKRSILHPGGVVVTTALAMAEYLGGASGKRFMTAMVAGYEIGARAGMSVGAAHLVAGWHPTGTHGTVAAGAAAGSLLGLSPDQMHHCLGIAGTQAGGLMASQFASMVKRFHAGRAAQSGVYGALLAKRGFTGITQLYESEYGGYCSTLSPRHDLTVLDKGLGSVWETAVAGFKPYSTNGSCQPSIDAMIELRSKHNFRLEDVESVHAEVSTATKEHVGWKYVPESITTAQMNLPYIIAVTIADGEAFVDQFTEERVRDPKLVAVADRVTVTVDPEIDAKGDTYRHFTRIALRLKDGRILRDERMSAKGSSAIPMTLEEVETKFRRLAAKALPESQVSELFDMVYRVDSLADVQELARMLVPVSR